MTILNRASLLGAVSALALSAAAFAQETEDGSDNANTLNLTEGTTQAATDSGRVLVEQGEPKVTVMIDDPSISVDQAAPEVTVEQPQPEITVRVPQPNVQVQQQAPIITVEQAQPEVTVRIPEPIITVRVPRPNVDVSQNDPDVQVETPQPIVRFIRPEPNITIEESEPNVTVEQAEATVNVSASQDANVEVSEADPVVNIEQTDDASVDVTSADPEVTIEDAPEADVNVRQADARVEILDYDTDASGNMQSDEDRRVYSEGFAQNPMADMTSDDLVGVTVVGESGETVGEIERIGVRGETIVAIVGVGGFLGLGEHDIALPVDRFQMNDSENTVVVPNQTQDELEEMPEYASNEVTDVEAGRPLGDYVQMQN